MLSSSGHCAVNISGRASKHATSSWVSARSLSRPSLQPRRAYPLCSVALVHKQVPRRQLLPKCRGKHGSLEYNRLFGKRLPPGLCCGKKSKNIFVESCWPTKIFLREKKKHENFLTRKFPDLRYKLKAVKCVKTRAKKRLLVC